MNEAWALIADLKKQLGKQQSALVADLDLSTPTKLRPLLADPEARKMVPVADKEHETPRQFSGFQAPPSPTALAQASGDQVVFCPLQGRRSRALASLLARRSALIPALSLWLLQVRRETKATPQRAAAPPLAHAWAHNVLGADATASPPPRAQPHGSERIRESWSGLAMPHDVAEQLQGSSRRATGGGGLTIASHAKRESHATRESASEAHPQPADGLLPDLSSGIVRAPSPCMQTRTSRYHQVLTTPRAGRRGWSWAGAGKYSRRRGVDWDEGH